MSNVESWEDYAVADGLLKKNGALNIAGRREMYSLLNSPCKGSYENGYGSFLESRNEDDWNE